MIGIIGALDVEVEGIINEMTGVSCRTISGIEYTSGKIYEKECVVARCGVGKVNAAVCAQTMILVFKTEMIINCGVAGALAQGIEIGDIVVASAVVQHDMNTTAIGEEYGLLSLAGEQIVYINTDKKLSSLIFDTASRLENTNAFMGKIATGDLFVSAKQQREKISRRFNAVACEMEGGAIGMVCYLNKIPFAVLRCMSDSIDKGEGMDFFEFKDLAAKKSIKIIVSLLKDMI